MRGESKSGRKGNGALLGFLCKMPARYSQSIILITDNLRRQTILMIKVTYLCSSTVCCWLRPVKGQQANHRGSTKHMAGIHYCWMWLYTVPIPNSTRCPFVNIQYPEDVVLDLIAVDWIVDKTYFDSQKAPNYSQQIKLKCGHFSIREALVKCFCLIVRM